MRAAFFVTCLADQFFAEAAADAVRQVGRGLAGRRVALHYGCHARRELGIATEPRELLERAGAEVVPWEAHQGSPPEAPGGG